MQDKDFTEFKSKLIGVGELYGKSISEALLDIYWNALHDLSIKEFNESISQHTVDPKEGVFFPKPANLIGKVRLSQADMDSKAKDTAGLLWEQVMISAGGRKDLNITDKKALAAIRALGGVRRIGMTTYDELVWVKKEFISSYVSYGRTPIDELPEHLSDVAESRRLESNTFKRLGMDDA